MNKGIFTFTGGYPIHQDDFGFLQDSWIETFKNLTQAFGVGEDEGYILFGCDLIDGGSFWTVEPGAIVLDGEVYTVDGGVLNKSLAGGNVHAWQVIEIQVASGSKAFEDAVFREVHQRRFAFPQEITPSGPYMPLLAPLLLDKITAASTPVEQTHVLQDAEIAAYYNASGLSVSVSGIASNNSKILRYYVQGKRVLLNWFIVGANAGQAQVDQFWIQLPAGMTVLGNIHRYDNGSGVFENILGGAETPPGVKQTNCLVSVGSSAGITNPGDIILIRPIRSLYEEFDADGANSVNLFGQIEFTID